MNKNIYTLTADSLSKRFGRQQLFKGLNLDLKTGMSLALTGPNGSGKSTLMHILAGVQAPTKGGVSYKIDGKDILPGDLYRHIGFASPMINPYDALTGYENILFTLRAKIDESELISLLDKFQILEHRGKSLKHYSSGMKQRLKFILAVINDPPILFLDEPGTNLDRSGKDIMYTFIDSIRKDKIILIATNEKEEAALCGEGLKIA